MSKKPASKDHPKQVRRTARRLYEFMRDNPELFAHPDAPPMLRKHWKTTAWNAAWTAADMFDE